MKDDPVEVVVPGQDHEVVGGRGAPMGSRAMVEGALGRDHGGRVPLRGVDAHRGRAVELAGGSGWSRRRPGRGWGWSSGMRSLVEGRCEGRGRPAGRQPGERTRHRISRFGDVNAVDENEPAGGAAEAGVGVDVERQDLLEHVEPAGRDAEGDVGALAVELAARHAGAEEVLGAGAVRGGGAGHGEVAGHVLVPGALVLDGVARPRVAGILGVRGPALDDVDRGVGPEHRRPVVVVIPRQDDEVVGGHRRLRGVEVDHDVALGRDEGGGVGLARLEAVRRGVGKRRDVRVWAIGLRARGGAGELRRRP